MNIRSREVKVSLAFLMIAVLTVSGAGRVSAGDATPQPTTPVPLPTLMMNGTPLKLVSVSHGPKTHVDPQTGALTTGEATVVVYRPSAPSDNLPANVDQSAGTDVPAAALSTCYVNYVAFAPTVQVSRTRVVFATGYVTNGTGCTGTVTWRVSLSYFQVSWRQKAISATKTSPPDGVEYDAGTQYTCGSATGGSWLTQIPGSASAQANLSCAP